MEIKWRLKRRRPPRRAPPPRQSKASFETGKPSRTRTNGTHELGGQYHDKLRAYAYMPAEGIWENPEKAGEVAAKLVEEGNTACKIDPFMPLFPLPRDIPLKDLKHAARIFRAIRDAVGDELEIGIGTHGQFSTSGAIRAAKVLEEFHPFWFEEPVPPENVDEMARVARQTSIPIATGERLVTKYEFAQILNKQAAGIIQLDVGQCGGILESKKIAGMAEAHFAMIAPHMYVGPIAAAAAVHVDTSSPNFLIQEYNGDSLHSDIFLDPIRFEQGLHHPTHDPGPRPLNSTRRWSPSTGPIGDRVKAFDSPSSVGATLVVARADRTEAARCAKRTRAGTSPAPTRPSQR